MTLNFCTYFDANYLDRGLLLYASLRRHCQDMRLFVLCLDHRCYSILADLALEALHPIALSELEAADPDLTAVKPHRTRIEYYFTLTPSFIRFVFASRPELDHVTYVDADLYFFSDPAPVIERLHLHEIGIVPHRYSPGLREMARFGKFNVAFNYFKRGDAALSCIDRWRAQCLEWCHDRYDGARYADQKYLDEWPQRYGDDIVITHPGVDLAPWNLGNHDVREISGRLTVDGAPVICFHFHGASRLAGALYDPNLRRYRGRLTPTLKDKVFLPYLRQLETLRRRHGRMLSGASIRRNLLKMSPRPPWADIARDGIDQLAGMVLTLISGTLIFAESTIETHPKRWKGRAGKNGASPRELPRLDRLPPLKASEIFSALFSRRGRVSSAPGAPILYGYGRQALGDAFTVCGVKPRDTVLYPDFVCDVTLAPIHRLGLNVAYYPVGDDLLPDWTRLEALALEAKASAVVSVNYFGFPQPMARWRRFTEEFGLSWINDNAHGYGSCLDGVSLDDFGDASVTSMRKVLPLINGAALKINVDDLARGAKPMPPSSPIAHIPIEEELQRCERSVARAFNRTERLPEATPYQRMPDAGERAERFRALDPLSRRLLAGYNRQRAFYAERRRRIYAAWQACLTQEGLQPVFPELPSGVSPMVYPCYADDFDERQIWLDWSISQNVDVYPWPSLPEDCRREGLAAFDRWRRMLCFPIHPFMDAAAIYDRFHRL